MALSKLTITPYEDDTYKTTAGAPFEVLINPESYTTDQTINYSEKQGLGTASPRLRFRSIAFSEVTFKLVFDGTNLIATVPPSLKGKSVSQQIEAFEKVAAKYSGKKHRPNPVTLAWGQGLELEGVLTKLTINYKLFNPDGTPLRAEASATFRSSSSSQETLLKAKNESPDVTHIKQVRAGDTLPGLCDEVYEDPNYFVQVAGANQLDRLRGIAVGQSLSFPPVMQP